MLLKGQLEEAQFENLATDPTNLPDGRAWVNTTAGRAKIAIAGGVKSVVTDDRMTAANISNAAVGNTSSTNVQNAINELQGDIDSINTTLPLKIDKSLLTTAGDMIYASAPNTPARLVNGAPGKVLKVGADGIPSWSFQAANGVNYITSGEADFGGIEKFKLFSDPVMATPPWAGDFVDGPANTGTIDGDTNVAVVYNSNYAYHDYPINGSDSYIFYKKAGNQQGKGFYVDFTINHSDYGHLLEISFQYNLSTIAGNPIPDGAVKVYIQHMWSANLTPLNPNTFGAYSKDYTSTFKALYQCQKSPYPLNSTEDMRLVFYISTNAIQSYYLTFDNLSVKPATNTSSTPITDEQLYTPTVQGLGTLAASNVNWSQLGDKLYLRGRVTIGTTSAVEARIYLPNTSMVVDDAKITAIQIVGDVTRTSATSAGNGGDWYLLAEPGVNYLTVGLLSPASGGLTKQNGSVVFNTGDIVSFNAIVPIKGWSSGLKTSTDAGTRPCFAMYRLASAAITGNQPINYATLVVDSHRAVTTGASWKFIAPFADVFEITAQGATGTSNTVYSVYKNGTLYSEIAYTVGGSATNHCANGSVLVPMNAGDYIDIRSYNSLTSTATLVSGSTVSTANYVFIRNVRAQQVIAASESVSCSVYLNANAAVAANGIIVYNSKEYDSHGAFDTSTGTFTAPQTAEYEFNGTSYLTTNSNCSVQIYKNAALYKVLHSISTVNGIGSGGTKIKLFAGETVSIRSSHSMTYMGGALSSQICTLQITKVGNY